MQKMEQERLFSLECLLNKNSYIYSLMQDGSHGAVRKALPFNEECLKEACKIVVEFVNEKYPEQIKSI